MYILFSKTYCYIKHTQFDGNNIKYFAGLQICYLYYKTVSVCGSTQVSVNYTYSRLKSCMWYYGLLWMVCIFWLFQNSSAKLEKFRTQYLKKLESYMWRSVHWISCFFYIIFSSLVIMPSTTMSLDERKIMDIFFKWQLLGPWCTSRTNMMFIVLSR